MRDGFKIAARRWVGKDLLAQGTSIEAAIGLQNAIAKALADCLQRGAAWGHDLSGDDIAIDDRNAVSRK
jgi:hypothetical protein